MIDIAKIKARYEAATGGPWTLETDSNGWIAVEDWLGGHIFRFDEREHSGTVKVCLGDARFIAHARKDLPDCTEEIDRLQGLVENAFFEALHYANPDALNPDQQAWVDSESRKALEPK